MCASQFVGPCKHDVEQERNDEAGDSPSKKAVTDIFGADCHEIAICIAQCACKFESNDEECALMSDSKPIESLIIGSCTLDPNSFSY